MRGAHRKNWVHDRSISKSGDLPEKNKSPLALARQGAPKPPKGFVTVLVNLLLPDIYSNAITAITAEAGWGDGVVQRLISGVCVCVGVKLLTRSGQWLIRRLRGRF